MENKSKFNLEKNIFHNLGFKKSINCVRYYSSILDFVTSNKESVTYGSLVLF